MIEVERSAKEGATERYRSKLLSRQNWFRKKGKKDEKKNKKHERKRKKEQMSKESKEIPVTSVIFVAKTKYSRLARRMKEAEETLSKLTKERIRVVERSGRTIKSLLCVNDLWSDAPCGREGCISCEGSQGQEEEVDGEERKGRGDREGKRGEKNKKKMNCFQRSLVYEVHCCECQQKVDEHKEAMKQRKQEEGGKNKKEAESEEKKKEEEKEAPKSYVYTGMTHLSGFERGKQHSYLLQSSNMEKVKVDDEEEEEDNKEGHMAVHVKMKHEGRKNVKFKMIAVRYHSSCFTRAVHEAVHLKYMSQRRDIAIMNGKSEMCSWTLPRLSLQTKSFAKKEKMEGEQEAPTQTQNISEHLEVTASSDQPNSIPFPTKDKVRNKFKQTLLSVHLKPKPRKQGEG